MPGLAGLISTEQDFSPSDFVSMLGVLRYGRAVITESFEESNISFGCVHLGTGGQRALFQSEHATVVFYGYLTHPPIPPGANPLNPNSAARYIHDNYLAYGEITLMSQLAGAFAFSIWDKRTETLFVISDHLGLRHIYYSEYNGVLRWASEIKAILIDPSIPRRLNLTAISEFFHFSYPLESNTFFHDIFLLPPASVLRYQGGRWEIKKYWDISYPIEYPVHPDKWYDDLIYNSLANAVERMAKSETRYGLSLSGGMDSRWIAAFLSKYIPQSKSFTVGISGSDDTAPALAVAAQTGLTNCYWDLSPNFVVNLAETYSYIVDGMYDLFSIDEFPLSIRVGEFVDVSVGGLLGDCLFGHEINPVSANLRRQDAKQYWLWRYKDTWLNPALGDLLFGTRHNRELEVLAKTSLENCFTSAPVERGFQVLQYFNLRNRQPRYINVAQQAKLTYVDIYHPLADLNVVMNALQIPPNQLLMERAYRRAMANYFPELAGIPWTFTLTPPTISVPGIIIKKTAQLTLGKWLRKTRFGNHYLIRPRKYYTNYSLWSRGPLRSYIENILFSQELDALGLFNPDGLRKVIFDHMDRKRDVTSFIGQALALALWARQFFVSSTPTHPNGLLLNSIESDRNNNA